MNKKLTILIICVILVSIAASLALNYRSIRRFVAFQSVDLSSGTGAIISTPDPDSKKMADEINNLQDSLPFVTPGFSISSYDFARGKFIVQSFYSGTNLQTDFDNWYSTSPFSSIPKSMFLLAQ